MEFIWFSIVALVDFLLVPFILPFFLYHPIILCGSEEGSVYCFSSRHYVFGGENPVFRRSARVHTVHTCYKWLCGKQNHYRTYYYELFFFFHPSVLVSVSLSVSLSHNTIYSLSLQSWIHNWYLVSAFFFVVVWVTYVWMWVCVCVCVNEKMIITACDNIFYHFDPEMKAVTSTIKKKMDFNENSYFLILFMTFCVFQALTNWIYDVFMWSSDKNLSIKKSFPPTRQNLAKMQMQLRRIFLLQRWHVYYASRNKKMLTLLTNWKNFIKFFQQFPSKSIIS